MLVYLQRKISPANRDYFSFTLHLHVSKEQSFYIVEVTFHLLANCMILMKNSFMQIEITNVAPTFFLFLFKFVKQEKYQVIWWVKALMLKSIKD